MVENKMKVKLGENKELVAFINDWKDGMPKEIYICIVDEDDTILQDICMVREHYHYSSQIEDFRIDSNFVDCKVWADSNSEDYTHEFTIGVYEEEEE